MMFWVTYMKQPYGILSTVLWHKPMGGTISELWMNPSDSVPNIPTVSRWQCWSRPLLYSFPMWHTWFRSERLEGISRIQTCSSAVPLCCGHPLLMHFKGNFQWFAIPGSQCAIVIGHQDRTNVVQNEEFLSFQIPSSWHSLKYDCNRKSW